jgi:hypothetical protein
LYLDVDCEVDWSPCDKDCKRIKTVLNHQGGNGDPCTPETKCTRDVRDNACKSNCISKIYTFYKTNLKNYNCFFV